MPIKWRDILEHGCGEIGFPVCCMEGVHVCLHGLCSGSSLNWGAGLSTMVRCCSLSVSCDSFSVGVNWKVVDLKLANWFLSCQNCSSRSAKV